MPKIGAQTVAQVAQKTRIVQLSAITVFLIRTGLDLSEEFAEKQ